MEDLIGDLTAVPQPVEIKLFSEDQAVLNELAPRLAAAISKIDGITDVNDGRNIAGDALEVRIDPTRAAVEGLDPIEIASTLEHTVAGSVPTQYQTFGQTPKVIGVRLLGPGSRRRTEDDLARIRILAADGHSVPLSRVAEIHPVSGQPQIQRENLRRMVAVTAQLSGSDLGSAIARVEDVLAQPALLVPAGGGAAPQVELGGLYQEQRTAFAGLLAVFGGAVVLLLLLLVFWYESLRVAVCLTLTSLLALPGVAAGLWATGTELNISAMMGLAMIVGSVTEVGVFLSSELLSPINGGRSAASRRDAIVEAALRRLRPITMTTLAATLAMLPLAVGFGEGADMLRPLAVAIITGLLVQLPLVLLVLPSLLFLTRAGAKPSK
jgi:multidrug efflux pump subunit AcrB